jgi:hypothetical protein
VSVQSDGQGSVLRSGGGQGVQTPNHHERCRPGHGWVGTHQPGEDSRAGSSARSPPGLRVADLAGVVAVDPKTVERWIWITKGRLPHRTHRLAVARALDDHD